MGGLSLTHWLVVLLVMVVLFGAGKLPRLMGDLATGIKTFKRSLGDDAGDSPPVATASTERRQPIEGRLDRSAGTSWPIAAERGGGRHRVSLSCSWPWASSLHRLVPPERRLRRGRRRRARADHDLAAAGPAC